MTQLNINIGLNKSKGVQTAINEETSAFNNPENLIQEFYTKEDPRSDNTGINTRIYFNKKLNKEGRNISFKSFFSKSNINNNWLYNFHRKYFYNVITSIIIIVILSLQFTHN